MADNVYHYEMLDPIDKKDLPDGITNYRLYKDAQGFGPLWVWGFVEYNRPLSDSDVERYNLDGPVKMN